MIWNIYKKRLLQFDVIKTIGWKFVVSGMQNTVLTSYSRDKKTAFKNGFNGVFVYSKLLQINIFV